MYVNNLNMKKFISFKKYLKLLNLLNDSKSILLNTLADKFSPEIVFNKKPFILTDTIALEICKILNIFLFNSKIINFPEIKVLTYNKICKELKYRHINYCNGDSCSFIPPLNNFFGIHSILIDYI